MARIWSRWETLLSLSLAMAAAAACGLSPSGSDFEQPPGADGSGNPDGGAAGSGGTGGGIDIDPGDAGDDPDDAGIAFDVHPEGLQTITVVAGQSTPTVTFSATLHGNAVSPAWSIDRGDVGSISGQPSSTATFVPSGKAGGLVTVVASLNGEIVERQILVRLTAHQNGADPSNPLTLSQIATDVADLKNGGGIGGVGGEGLGPGVTDPGILDAFDDPVSDGEAEGLELLYPYDRTVWPRGLLAPLLMWRWNENDADAIRIELETTSGSFSWKGTFARPEILATTGGAFIRHPIPQDVWEMATNTAGGPTVDSSQDRIRLRLTIAKDGQAYGPIEQTWTIAPARLSGIIYYNSYGTQLAKNFDGAVGGDERFGGAVLSIHVGDTGPKLVAGNHGDSSQCRVCHSVAPSGSRLIVQHGNDNAKSSAYDLDPSGPSTEHVLQNGAEFAALYPDGSMALTGDGKLLSLPDDSTPLPVSGLEKISRLASPRFSADGKLVAFAPISGTLVDNPKQKLVVMSFDAATGTFSNPVTIVDETGQPSGVRPGWPAFFPDGKAVVFHRQSDRGNEAEAPNGDLRTRRGAKAQIAWTSIDDPNDVTVLNWLNGLDDAGHSYLPKLHQPIVMSCTADGTSVGGIDADHADDVNLNYEPTVNPVASGGYAWVVFTSRRMYGNVATIPPFCSDPRGVDLVTNITTKKLWVAAVDLNAKPGEDGSHPAFYLPGQELLAGNSLGFWVLDPCRPDGESCESGDQCCGGFCRPSGDGSALVCSEAPPDAQCSWLQEKCETNADCCDSRHVCLGGFCVEPGPK